jgi:hypothetical protein
VPRLKEGLGTIAFPGGAVSVGDGVKLAYTSEIHAYSEDGVTGQCNEAKMSRFQSQVREAINRNTFISLALEQGYNVFLPVYDDGVDFILHHERKNETRKVQLKGRWTIDRKYVDRDIWIAFPIGEEWYLMPHDQMVSSAEAGVTKSKSWVEGGLYSRPKPSAVTIAACAQYRFKLPSEDAAELAGSTFEDRLTWKEGDLEFINVGTGKPHSDQD